MSFLYPRTISIYRAPTGLAAGDAGYLGYRRTTEISIYSGIPASVQSLSMGAQGIGIVPDDAAGPVRWNIYVAARLVPKGTVLSRDIIIDDDANRYQVASAYWTTLGWKIQTIRLEA